MLQHLFQHTSPARFDREFEDYEKSCAALEYCLDSNDLDVWYTSRVRRQLERFKRGYNAPIAIHGPVYSFDPVSNDQAIAELAWRRCMTIFDVAKWLQPEVIVFHSNFNPYCHMHLEKRWQEQTSAFWTRCLEQLPDDRVKVVVENIYDVDPEPLAAMIHTVGHPRFGFCLDVGHHNAFCSGPVLDEYIVPFGDKLMHVHLHDNDGVDDLHLPPGRGSIDYEPLLRHLRAKKSPWTLTVECRDSESNQEALDWVEKHFPRGRSRGTPAHNRVA